MKRCLACSEAVQIQPWWRRKLTVLKQQAAWGAPSHQQTCLLVTAVSYSVHETAHQNGRIIEGRGGGKLEAKELPENSVRCARATEGSLASACA